MLSQDNYILLFENCQLTKGHTRTLLIDLQRNSFEFLPNEMHLILKSFSRKHTVRQILALFEPDSTLILEYFDFLLLNDYAFECTKDEINFFPPLSTDWDYPAEITNCIIDFNKTPVNLSVYKKVLKQLGQLNCQSLQIRCFSDLPLSFIESFLNIITGTKIIRADVLLKYNREIHLAGYKKILNWPFINNLILHSADKDKRFAYKNKQVLTFLAQEINDDSCCGNIAFSNFVFNVEFYTESLSFNSCLNRKVGIDVNGNIKNCPSGKTAFGNIKTHSISDIVNLDRFQSVWKISKDKIADCKSCEFRNVCTDCRVFIKDQDNIFSKPSKCNYNPWMGTYDD